MISDAYILMRENITITEAGAHDAAKRTDKRDKEVIFKDCAPSTDCISEINYTQADK